MPEEEIFEEAESVGTEALYRIEYIIAQLEKLLRGYTLTMKENKVIAKKTGENLLNEEGIQSVLSIFYSFCHPVLHGTSNIDRMTANALIENFADTLIHALVTNASKWQLKKGNFLVVYNLLLDAYVMVISRSEKGYGLFLSHNVVPPTQQSRFIFPFGRKETIQEESE